MPDRHYLTPLFEPSSVAVFGAGVRPDSVGAIAFNNVIAGGFAGDVYPLIQNTSTVITVKNFGYRQKSALPERALTLAKCDGVT